MTDFQNNIKDWVFLDNKIKIKNKELYELRNQRKNLTENIYSYVETQNLENAIIEISDGTLKFQQNKSTKPLTYKFIDKCLLDCIGDEDKVKSIIKYMKAKREFSYNSDIKRNYKD
jgi:hypothetical protein